MDTLQGGPADKMADRPLSPADGREKQPVPPPSETLVDEVAHADAKKPRPERTAVFGDYTVSRALWHGRRLAWHR